MNGCKGDNNCHCKELNEKGIMPAYHVEVGDKPSRVRAVHEDIFKECLEDAIVLVGEDISSLKRTGSTEVIQLNEMRKDRVYRVACALFDKRAQHSFYMK